MEPFWLMVRTFARILKWVCNPASHSSRCNIRKCTFTIISDRRDQSRWAVFDGVTAIGGKCLADAQRNGWQRFRREALDGIAVDIGDLGGGCGRHPAFLRDSLTVRHRSQKS